jgi:hypothetical protein
MLALCGSFTLFRGISIFIAIRIKPEIMLIINFMIIIIANMILIIDGYKSFSLMIFVSENSKLEKDIQNMFSIFLGKYSIRSRVFINNTNYLFISRTIHTL